MRRIAAALLLWCAAVPVRLAAFQCPDGTPPPCATRMRAPPAPAERARAFVVLPFRNLSRSPELEWLVEGSSTLLGDAMGHWRDVNVVPDERLVPALQRVGIVPGAVASHAAMRRLAEETGGWTVVTGEMLVTGGRVAVRARAIDALTGRELVRAAADVAADADVREAFGRIGAQLLRAAGLDAADVDIGAGTTRSLDAYRAYARGLGHWQRNRYRSAADAFAEAVRHDTVFAQAWFGRMGALLFAWPSQMFDPGSDLHAAAGRAQTLAERLPPRQRDLVLAVGAMFRGRFGAARELIEQVVAADSSDHRALGWLAFLEYADPILAPSPEGPRRRGSLQRSVDLARRILMLEPGFHGAYIPIVYSYLLAAGDIPGVSVAFPRELTSLDGLFRTAPAAVFVPLLRDSIELIPVDLFATMPADSIAAARALALAEARRWTDRWLAAGPNEGAAYQAAARVSELDGNLDAAFDALRRADSLGVEFGYINSRFQRLGLLARAGRYAAAAALADSLWPQILRGAVAPDDRFDARRWAFNLLVMQARFARADSLAAVVSAAVARFAGGDPNPLTDGVARALLAGRIIRPIWMTQLPLQVRFDALDSAQARLDHTPSAASGRAAVDLLARWAVADAAADSVMTARARAAGWYRP